MYVCMCEGVVVCMYICVCKGVVVCMYICIYICVRV